MLFKSMNTFTFAILAMASMTALQAESEGNNAYFYTQEDSAEVREKKAAALLNDAIAFYDENGKEKALLEFRNPDGKFCTQYKYDPSGLILSDENGIFLSYCKSPCMVGKHSHAMKTPDSEEPFKQLSSKMDKSTDKLSKMKVVTTMNPFTGKVTEAVILAKKHDGKVFMNVVYDDTPIVGMEPMKVCAKKKSK